MPGFSRSSKSKLLTCHPQLQALFNEVISTYDCKILCGHRGEKKQTKAFLKGSSKVQYPNSMHNQNTSLAVDVAPFPIDWHDMRAWYHFGGYVKRTAEDMGINIRWGGDWDGDFDLKDQNFNDLPHFELIL